ncbi:MAG: hypothetical protein ACLVMH_05255 [Christensenellales bacterium]
MNKTDAIWTELYNAAKAVLKPRGVSSIIARRVVTPGDLTPEWWI